ncbi:glycosyltransferase family 2 protein [Caldalkalibacillus thermarum]|uniref:glycosyltransferase family 2 protein n=1 Tax=Caldalkalibacillus thermarum TaxID=296745 RepID=UPI00227BF4B0|nr:glycosyltransferase family 2 protein [Caldalkalibacillus thermarum]
MDILIPAHNEEVVIKETLEAMCALEYPGKLNVFLLDDRSTDRTAEIAKEFQKTFSRVHYISVPPGKPRGKARVLNYGLSVTQADYIVVFDADNRPEPSAVKLLVEAAESDPRAAGAVGYVKTINADTNLLTRMIALEFQVFQLIMQSGRWQLFKLGSLPGTNMLLKRAVIDELGGYDPWALAEDAELTMRITASGYTLPVVSESVTWEQEPENLKTFLKQRTRWFMGNIYLLEKSFFQTSYWKKKALFHSVQHVLTYLLFAVLLLVSHLILILSLVDLITPIYTAPILMFW